jgi:ubiquinone/menaquinone biosynthesis C-methylase UbiE
MYSQLVEYVPKIEGDRGTADRRPYALGYTDGEFRRLELQGALLHDLTRDVLCRAGIQPGMRVLDIGCGVGDVSLLAGKLVGAKGKVFGIDRSAEAIALAERRATEAGQCYWTRFVSGDLDTFVPEETFDAVIGRLILMYLPDPAATLRRLAGYVRPGGIVAFQELSMPLARSVPEGPLYSRCIGWIIDTIAGAGFEVDMGGKLPMTFAAAGLPIPQMNSAALIGGGPNTPIYNYLAETLRSLLPMAERVGVTTAAEMGIDTLAERLRREAVGQQACVMTPPLCGRLDEHACLNARNPRRLRICSTELCASESRISCPFAQAGHSSTVGGLRFRRFD